MGAAVSVGMVYFATRRPQPVNPASWSANARHRSQVAMGFTADVVFEADVIAQRVDEAGLQITAVILRIVNGDDVLKLGRADPADALHCAHLVGMRRTGRIDESLFVEACGVDHQRIARELTDRVTVVERECGQLPHCRHHLVHGDHADLVVELMDDGDLPGRRLNDLERIGRGGSPSGTQNFLAASVREPSFRPAMFFS